MTRERLRSLSMETLHALAEKEGIEESFNGDREQFIGLLLEAMEEDREEQKGSNNEAMRLKIKKYDIFLEEELEPQEKREYPLPENYNETEIRFLLRDPLWAFAYWEIKESEFEVFREDPWFEGLYLRVHELAENGSSTGAFDIPVSETDKSWYINLNRAGGSYRIDLMCGINGREKLLASSNVIKSPLGYISENKEDFYSDPDYMMLIFSGLWDFDWQMEENAVPRRILTILDNQDLSISL